MRLECNRGGNFERFHYWMVWILYQWRILCVRCICLRGDLFQRLEGRSDHQEGGYFEWGDLTFWWGICVWLLSLSAFSKMDTRWEKQELMFEGGTKVDVVSKSFIDAVNSWHFLGMNLPPSQIKSLHKMPFSCYLVVNVIKRKTGIRMQ